MAPLLQTNPYLLNAVARAAMLVRNAVESSTFEGARGLKVGAMKRHQPAASTARFKASAKKVVSKS